jgi:Fur family ferric uptake transcriptional regulator
VTEFQNEELKNAIGSVKLNRFQMSHYSIYIYGLCAKCVRANKKKEKSKNNNNKEK